VCGAALLVWFVAVCGLRAATGDVAASRVVLDGGTPAALYLPASPGGTPLPVALLAHDFAGSSGQLGFLARQLARAGWAALALDLQGHARNPARFAFDGRNRALARELEQALEWVASRAGELDPARVVLVGHGMGALAALQQAQWDPSGVEAVIALAAPRDVTGPYAAPNTLLLWGTWDLPGVRDAGRALGARLAGRTQLVGERTYGDPARGSAVRIAELTGLGHWSLLWSQASATRILDWLDPERTVEPAERKAPWAVLGWLALVVLVWELPRVLREVWLPETLARPGDAPLRLAGLGAALLASAWLIVAAPDGPLGVLPLAGAREPLALLGLSGLGVLLLWTRAWSGAALRRPGTWLGAAALAGTLYLLGGPLLAPWLDPWPAPQRLLAIALASAALLPHFAALEWLLRVPGWAGLLLPGLARVLAIGLLAAAALAGLLPEASLSAARCLLLGAPLLELLAQRCARLAPSPWTSALAQSLWVGWILGTSFPLDG
jgi:pimeloyl-ACP methyl ester carboxylesterase